MRLRALLGAALAAVLMIAVLPSAAEQARPAVVRTDGASRDGTADSSAGCPKGSVAFDGVDGHLYKYCGQHWPLNKLPIRVHVNRDQAPNKGAFQEAVAQAVAIWDVAAPIRGTGSRPPGCATANIICVATVSDGAGVPAEIDVGWQPRGPFGLPGIAEVFAAGSGEITDVKVTLNSNLSWFGTNDAGKVSTGVGSGLAGGIGCGPAPQLCPWSFDLVSIIMHELGHVLGLEDLNPGASCDDGFECGYPADPQDAPDFTQVMYAFYYPGSSTKRALQEGDLAGLYRVLLDSQTN